MKTTMNDEHWMQHALELAHKAEAAGESLGPSTGSGLWFLIACVHGVRSLIFDCVQQQSF